MRTGRSDGVFSGDDCVTADNVDDGGSIGWVVEVRVNLWPASFMSISCCTQSLLKNFFGQMRRELQVAQRPACRIRIELFATVPSLQSVGKPSSEQQRS